MFRWLKGSKNKRKDKTTDDKYGFQDQITQYGLRKNKGGGEIMDSSLHIYDEISELPEISFSRQFTLLPEETNIGKNVEGPYLVVPILPARKTSDTCGDNSKDPKSNREKSNLSLKKPVYNEPWDISSEELSEYQLDSFVHPAYRDSDSGYTYNSVSNKTDSERISDSDTGCEYDMSTSTESDVSSEYKELINKMQNNLVLKHQVLKMIKETETGKSSRNLNKISSSSLDSAEFIRSHDVPDDDTESDYSSGFDDCETNGNTTSDNIQYDIPPCSKCVGATSDTASCQMLRKKGYCVSENVRNPRALSRKSSNHSHENVAKDIRGDKQNAKRNSWTGFVPKHTNIYNTQNIKRKTSSNRLLGDLINMNHNIQTLKF